MFWNSNSKPKAIVKEGFLTPKEDCYISRLTEATLTIYPNGICLVRHLNEVYEAVIGDGPRYEVKDNDQRGYAEFLAIE